MNKQNPAYKQYLEHLSSLKKLGYDIEENRNFVIEVAKPIYEPILELATGKGHMALALARQRYSLTSIDTSSEAQELARSIIDSCDLSRYVKFDTRDAHSLRFRDGAFNTIFCANALHHFKDPLSVVKECLRLLRRDGKLVISDFNKEGIAIISKISKSQGHQHPAWRETISELEEFFNQKHYQFQRYDSKLQEVLVVQS